jgi:PHD/YefM family antitoxin component YafN of YafNO toxin-antitoxin module
MEIKSLLKIAIKRSVIMAEVMLSPSELITSTKAATQLSRLLDRLPNQRWFIQRRGKIEGVLISLEEYKRLLALEEALEHIALGRLIEERERVGPEDYLDLDDVLRELGIEA